MKDKALEKENVDFVINIFMGKKESEELSISMKNILSKFQSLKEGKIVDIIRENFPTKEEVQDSLSKIQEDKDVKNIRINFVHSGDEWIAKEIDKIKMFYRESIKGLGEKFPNLKNILYKYYSCGAESKAKFLKETLRDVILESLKIIKKENQISVYNKLTKANIDPNEHYEGIKLGANIYNEKYKQEVNKKRAQKKPLSQEYLIDPKNLEMIQTIKADKSFVFTELLGNPFENKESLKKVYKLYEEGDFLMEPRESSCKIKWHIDSLHEAMQKE